VPEPADVVDAQLVAYNARDLERFLGCYSTKAVITNSAGDVLAKGHKGIRAMYGPLFDQCPDLSANVMSRITNGNFVVDHEKVTGFMGPVDLRRVNQPGYPTSLEAIAVYEVTDGEISRVALYS
jgi:hypothetical protein